MTMRSCPLPDFGDFAILAEAKVGIVVGRRDQDLFVYGRLVSLQDQLPATGFSFHRVPATKFSCPAPSWPSRTL